MYKRQALHYLCEPVTPPRDVEQFLRYFCGDAYDAGALDATEALRISFYKAVALYARAYAELATHLTEAGYTDTEVAAIKGEVEFYVDIRASIKKHAGEELDIKPFEADMRHLLNTYVQADAAADLGDLGALSLTELIVQSGIHDAIAKKLNAQGKLSRKAIAEGIINNVRKTIIREQLTDPKFYEQMSKLLDDLIAQSRSDAEAYEEFLRKAEDLVRKLAEMQPGANVPIVLHGNLEAATIYNNLDSIRATTFKYPTDEEYRAALALQIDRAVRERAPAGWKGDETRERTVQNAIFPLLDRDREATQALFDIIKHQSGY